jgi:hypothetical protein
MMTIDARLLVRGDRDVREALEQLLTGVLRVHAVVELVTLPSGVVVPGATVHRLPRSAHHVAVRDWRGDAR